MNKEKALKIITTLKQKISERQNEETRIYINSWVIGTLEDLENKINGEYVYDNPTYVQIFESFIRYYFCLNINPRIKIQTISCLFTYEIRDLIIDLFKVAFSKQYRDECCKLSGYITDCNNTSLFEVIRNTYCRMGA